MRGCGLLPGAGCCRSVARFAAGVRGACGVCSWGVPLGTDSGEVLVGGGLLDAGDATVRYAASAADFIAARRWDGQCLSGEPLLQAQAPELDGASLARLEGLLSPTVPTAG